MDIHELQDKLMGVYDFTNVVDCQSVIRILLIDLEVEKKRSDILNTRLNSLAKLVQDGDPEAKSYAEGIITGVRKKADVMAFLEKMSISMDNAEAMSDKDLHEAAMLVWSEFSLHSKESGVLGELLRRFSLKNNDLSQWTKEVLENCKDTPNDGDEMPEMR